MFFLWIGVFSLMVIAQFWAYANDIYTPDEGKRLFALIAFGASLGAVFGSFISGRLIGVLGVHAMLLVAAVILASSLIVFNVIDLRERSRGHRLGATEKDAQIGRGSAFGLVLRNRYLLLVAVMILLLNWVNTTGEYILAELVVRQAEVVAAGSEGAKGDFIAAFYGNYFFTVNLVTVFVQVFLVARIIRRIGVQRAVLILPLISLAGYGLVAFLPVFSILRVVKILENSTDYSLMNTTNPTRVRGLSFSIR